MSGNNVSHSKRRTKRVFRPNLQRVRAMVGKSPVILKVCTRCLRSGLVLKRGKPEREEEFVPKVAAAEA
jgi:large subunit ribosomal protein L28